MKKVLYAVVFVLSMALIIIGHQNIGPSGLALMLAGLSLIIGLLWYYNRSYQ